MENLKKMFKEKREFSIACVIIIILSFVTIWLAFCKQVPKTKNGEDIIASIKEYNVTADKLFAQLKADNGSKALLELIDTYIADKEVKFTKDDEKYVDNVIDYYKQYADYYGVSFEEFLAQYAGISGVTTEEEFREFVKADYKKTLAVIKYIGKQLTKEEIQDYYDENYSETMTVKHILIETSDDVSEEDALNEAKDLIKQLKEVKDDSKKLNELFKDLAYNHSSDSTYATEGLIENFSKKDVVEEFWNAAEDLKDGEFTVEPVKTEYGYHIILKVNSSSQKKLKDVKDEVVKALAQSKLSSDSNLQFTTWDELRKKYKFKINDSNMKKIYNETIDGYKNKDNNEDTNSSEESSNTAETNNSEE